MKEERTFVAIYFQAVNDGILGRKLTICIGAVLIPDRLFRRLAYGAPLHSTTN